jgi:hypothetical protein
MSNQPATLTVLVPTGLRFLPGDQRDLAAEMLSAYAVRRGGALRHERKSLQRDLRVIDDFTRFTGQPPWSWTGDGFEAWCHHLGIDRRLAVASQRHYQSAIRSFMHYLTENVKFRNEVYRRRQTWSRQST